MAVAAYQGIYVIVNPYNATQVKQLQKAAQTPCAQNQQPVVSPFCGAANGILLRFGLCDFELYHVTAPSGAAYPSCHYVVGYSGGAGSKGIEIPSSDTISPCPHSYDECTGTQASVLGATLGLINQVNGARADADLSPLKLSVGMFAGVATAQAVLDSVGWVDVPHNTTANGNAASTQCYRLPLVWSSKFVNQYNAAQDELIAYIQSQMPTGANITMLKSAGISGNDLEIEMPGKAQTVSVPADLGSGGPGGTLRCSSSIPAGQVWLNAYNAAPVNRRTFAQAVENSFGSFIGHELATLTGAGFKQALLSVATANSLALANVDCGSTGAGACSVQQGSGTWSTYYVELYVDDLFDGGLAGTAAAAAYESVRNDTFSLAPAQAAINSTGLSPQTIDSATEISCTLNNTNPVHAQSFTLDKQPLAVLGAGTTLGWQTKTNQGSLCETGTSYGTALNNGIDDGALFLEIEPDAAFKHINACSPFLTSALTRILAQTPPTVCQY